MERYANSAAKGYDAIYRMLVEGQKNSKFRRVSRVGISKAQEQSHGNF